MAAALVAAGFVTAGPSPNAGTQLPRPFEYQQVHMGVPVRILLHASEERRAETAARAAFDRIAKLDRLMSDYRAESEIQRLAGGGWTPVSPDLLEVISTALTVARGTDGAFDPTLGPLVSLWRESRQSGKLPPADALAEARERVGWRHLEVDRARGAVRLARAGMQVDLGGIAKGYILQEALRTLRTQGIGRALIEAGGDIVTGNGPPGQLGWRVDAPDADEVFRSRARALANAALATSGPGEQFIEIDGVSYSHIVDARTGLGVTNRVTAQVIARDAALADALATALTVVGPAGAAAILEKFPDIVISLTSK